MIGKLKTEADVERFVRSLLSEHGVVQMNAVSGQLDGRRVATPLHLPTLDTDPDAVADTALLYSVLTGGKVDLRVRFPTGAPITISIEV